MKKLIAIFISAFIFFTILFISSASFAEGQERTLGDDMYEARVLYKKGKYIDAKERFQAILSRYKTDDHATKYALRCINEIDEILGVRPEDKRSKSVYDHKVSGKVKEPMVSKEKSASRPVAVGERRSFAEERPVVGRVKRRTETSRYIIRDVGRADKEEVMKKALRAVTYFAISKYKDSETKDRSFATGVYLSADIEKGHRVEFELDYTKIKLKDVKTTDQHEKKTDFTTLYTNTTDPEYTFRGGVHLMRSVTEASDDDVDRETIVFIGGIERALNDITDVGLDLYFSNYHRVETNDPEFNAVQFTPIIGSYIFSRAEKRLYMQLKGNGIYILDNILDSEDDFYSIEASFSYFFPKLVLNGFVWVGDQKYAVRNRGFDVYTDSDQHKGGWGASLKWPWQDNMNLSFSYSTEVIEYGNNDGYGNLFVMSFDYAY